MTMHAHSVSANGCECIKSSLWYLKVSHPRINRVHTIFYTTENEDKMLRWKKVSLLGLTTGFSQQEGINKRVQLSVGGPTFEIFCPLCLPTRWVPTLSQPMLFVPVRKLWDSCWHDSCCFVPALHGLTSTINDCDSWMKSEISSRAENFFNHGNYWFVQWLLSLINLNFLVVYYFVNLSKVPWVFP